MKIRTDFVTNSSSSSFCIEIIVTDKEGKEYTTLLDPSYGGEGCGDVNLECKASDVLKSGSVAELMDMLQKSLAFDECDVDEDNLTNQFMDFSNQVKESLNDINDIDKVTLKRLWFAWGEAASAFGWNLDCYAEELPGLAKAVCEAEGDEKEEAKKKLAEYIDNCNLSLEGGWQASWPSNFCNTNPNTKINYSKLVETLEEFAQKVVEEDLPNDDVAVETVILNMKDKKVESSAEYMLGASPEWFGDMDEDWDEDEE